MGTCGECGGLRGVLGPIVATQSHFLSPDPARKTPATPRNPRREKLWRYGAACFALFVTTRQIA